MTVELLRRRQTSAAEESGARHAASELENGIYNLRRFVYLKQAGVVRFCRPRSVWTVENGRSGPQNITKST